MENPTSRTAALASDLDQLYLRSVSLDRQRFIDHINEAVADARATVHWHSSDWIAEIHREPNMSFIIGNTFSINNASSAKLADDKVATASVLAAAGVACVPHALVRLDSHEGADLVAQYVENAGPIDLVVKPIAGSCGRDVLRVRNLGELKSVLADLSTRYQAVSLSPFVDITDEFRTVFLDGKLLVAFRKLRARNTDIASSGIKDSEWRHNLHLGAVPEICGAGSELDRLMILGKRAMVVLGLRFGAVDIVVTNGRDLVLEVNSAVTLSAFSRHSHENRRLVSWVYSEAVEACLCNDGYDSPDVIKSTQTVL